MQMIKQQINIKVLIADLDMIFTADKGEPGSQFKEERPYMQKQSFLKITLCVVIPEAEKVEIIWVFEYLLCQFGLRCRQRNTEIAYCTSLALKESAFNLADKYISTPAMLYGATNLPFTFRWVLNIVQNPNIMAPRNLCNNLLHKYNVRPCLGKSSHIF